MKHISALLAVIAVGLLSLGTVATGARAAELWQSLSAPAAMPEPTVSGYANVDGVKIYFATFGSGEPLVLLHGGLGNTDYWGGQIAAFSAKHKVIAIASRGHGRSTNDGSPLGYHLMATDVLAVMDALDIDKAAIVGWSDGGNIGLDIAINHPDRLTKLFAFGANYNPSGVMPSVETNATFGAYVTLSGEYYGKLSATPAKFDDFVGELVKMWADQPNFSPAQLGSIPVPVAIADGEHDEAIDPKHTAKMASLIPGAKLVILPGLSHFAMWQDPGTFNAAVLKYLAQ